VAADRVGVALIMRGTLEVGDAVVAGAQWGRVRAMHDFLGKRVTQATGGNGSPGEAFSCDHRTTPSGPAI
jgi:translation initiation factor IF-2